MKPLLRLLIGEYAMFVSSDAQTWIGVWTYRWWNVSKAVKFLEWAYRNCDAEDFIQIVNLRNNKTLFFGAPKIRLWQNLPLREKLSSRIASFAGENPSRMEWFNVIGLWNRSRG